eukprot:Anaeramoba_ignava/a89827_166.p2 GENE.a89827_166~~a89827_166.p2  ORF type:complete len:676 (+),score=169.22 a89827_166:2640-4667(+)
MMQKIIKKFGQNGIRNFATYPGLLRSMLFVPPSKIELALSSPADSFIVDLEDSVPKQEKESRRNFWAKALREDILKGRPTFVRCNAISAGFEQAKKDIQELGVKSVTGIMVPMLETADELHEYEKIMRGCENRDLFLFGLVETPKGVMNAYKIATGSERLVAMCLGHLDYITVAHCANTVPGLQYPKNVIIHAARSRDLLPIESVTTGYKNHEHFEADARLSREMGFAGKAVLTADQVYITNSIFSPSPKEIAWSRRLLGFEKEGTFSDKGRMWGPPFMLMAKYHLEQHEAAKKMEEKQIEKPVDSLKCVFYEYGLKPQKIEPNLKLQSSYSLTVTDSWLSTWQSSYFDVSPIYISEIEAKKLGFKNILLPPSLLSTLSIAMVVLQYSADHALLLGFRNGKYLRPAYPGDTFTTDMKIEGYRNLSGQKGCVIYTQHILKNQHGEPVFSLQKQTLFDYSVQSSQEIPEFVEKEFNNEDSLLKKHLIENVKPKEDELLSAELEQGIVVVHPTSKSIEFAENQQLCTLLKVNNSHIANKMKFLPTELLVAGPYSTAAALAISSIDFGEVFMQDFIYSSNISKMNPGAMLSAISYIVDIKAIKENPNLEEVTVLTLGLSNFDVENLRMWPVPKSLFANPFVQKTPVQYELICRTDCPYFLHKIVNQTLRKIIRRKPHKS